jgi:hypothetical protein
MNSISPNVLVGTVRVFVSTCHLFSWLNWKEVVWSSLVWPHLHRQVLLYDMKNKNSIMCKTQIHVQPLINIQSSNPCQFLHHKHLYLRSMSFFNFSNHIKFSNLWSFLAFSNSQIYGRSSLSQILVQRRNQRMP